MDLLLRPELDTTYRNRRPSRNPCCSGPTASTQPRYRKHLTDKVAIPVVVDLLLRQLKNLRTMKCVEIVAIPVVVDLLLRPEGEISPPKIGQLCRNPCCSGPTASTLLGSLRGI